MPTAKKQQTVRQLPMVGRRFEQIFHRDHRSCECEIPMVSRKWNDALGTFVAIRLCCMAKALEEITGQKLYEVFEFDPKWVWDCAELHQSASDDGTVEMTARGAPPEWLRKRLENKGIEIRNLPSAE